MHQVPLFESSNPSQPESCSKSFLRSRENFGEVNFGLMATMLHQLAEEEIGALLSDTSKTKAYHQTNLDSSEVIPCGLATGWIDFGSSLITTLFRRKNMCVSAAPADFSDTTVMVYHRRDGSQVVGYQNAVVNLAKQANSDFGWDKPAKEQAGLLGNAMILHVPTESLTEADFIPTAKMPNILDDMVLALQPRMRGGFTRGESFGAAKGIFVFEYGIYTNVVVQRASVDEIVKAL